MSDELEDLDAGSARSGRYPGVSLDDALKAADKLYKAERQSPVDNATAVEKMGFKALSGTARVMIGALRQYGLIERTNAKQFRLSRLAILALHGDNGQRAKALSTAALNPPLFAELYRSHFAGSEENIKSHLITNKGFIDTGARNAARAFRETIAIAKLSAPDYDRLTADDNDENNSRSQGDDPMESQTQPIAGGQPGSMIPPLSLLLNVQRNVKADLRISGKDVRREDLERLKRQIDMLLETFPEEG